MCKCQWEDTGGLCWRPGLRPIRCGDNYDNCGDYVPDPDYEEAEDEVQKDTNKA